MIRGRTVEFSDMSVLKKGTEKFKQTGIQISLQSQISTYFKYELSDYKPLWSRGR